jgi:ubiquinone/menaquinone biosynthesis C-methylase UbiE
MDPEPVALARAADWRRDWDRMLLDASQIRAWDRMLFVQCGDGWIAEEAWRRMLRGFAYGVDTSPDHVHQATLLRGVPGRVEFGDWDGARLPCASQSFHRVYATFALERCPDPVLLVSELRRVLRPGGELYMLELQPVPTLAAELVGAGFPPSHEVLQRAPEGNVTGVILHARCTEPPVLPDAVEPAA